MRVKLPGQGGTLKPIRLPLPSTQQNNMAKSNWTLVLRPLIRMWCRICLAVAYAIEDLVAEIELEMLYPECGPHQSKTSVDQQSYVN
jgi:hypothetical protein